MGDYSGRVLDSASRVLAGFAVLRFIIYLKDFQISDVLRFLLEIYSKTTHLIFDYSVGVILYQFNVVVSLFFKDLAIIYFLVGFAVYRALKRIMGRIPRYKLDGSIVPPPYPYIRLISAMWPFIISIFLIDLFLEFSRRIVFVNKTLRKPFWRNELFLDFKDVLLEIIYVALVVFVILATNALTLGPS